MPPSRRQDTISDILPRQPRTTTAEQKAGWC
jgi:hypothetical protein